MVSKYVNLLSKQVKVFILSVSDIHYDTLTLEPQYSKTSPYLI
jgi:hypothetical protein